eukprot:CAMPEP_0202961964 /NCGR_PEP_ID=MMETSP1396-20130829/6066_1 /ASSEMBLY_ACC=CAM_ASM_000872 /TAXON_ID= /ORGANISM="Pseudokeronopsis sp., Strain Brazil" /LENGTH=71 /DNA_ID=CAMNT_0049682215 /DNA_START=643 /DNA_END=858 /DNA_ORIENTATION=-
MVEQVDAASLDNNFDTQSIPVLSFKMDEAGAENHDFVSYSSAAKKDNFREEEQRMSYSIVQSYVKETESEK